MRFMVFVVLWLACAAGAPILAHARETHPSSRSQPQVEWVAAPVSETGMANLRALARAGGVVRHFHPSDRCREVDWTAWFAAGITGLEGLEAQAFPDQLKSLLRTVEPGARVLTSPEVANPEPESPPEGATAWLSWRYRGYSGQETRGAMHNIYGVKLERIELAAWDEAADVPGTRPGKIMRVELGGGLNALVRIGAWANDAGTLPQPSLPLPAPVEGWKPRPEDRASRIACVMVAWNIFQHFYPYFEVVGTDWDAELSKAIRGAAEARDRDEMHAVMERLAAALHDGHAWVNSPSHERWVLPVRLQWIEGAMVVAGVGEGAPPALQVGDRLERIDETPVADLIAAYRGRTSSATEQWMMHRMERRLCRRKEGGPVALSLRKPDGEEATVILQPVMQEQKIDDVVRPANGSELAKGVMYFDLNGTETPELMKWLPRLAESPAVVFDLRGYPGGAGAVLLGHLSARRMTSARWMIPIVVLPDRNGWDYERSNWDIRPLQPRVRGRVFFVTDGRAISYAESCMGVVEHYKLGEIVGAATAGTNGNVNPLSLPLGFTIMWTGMRVDKHDGSRHHGVGILPTIPAARTVRGVAEGRDEVLEAAVAAAVKAISGEEQPAPAPGP